jgi:hypothetical protein
MYFISAVFAGSVITVGFGKIFAILGRLFRAKLMHQGRG